MAPKHDNNHKAALVEKKANPVIQVLKHHDLAKRIVELTEDLEELRTEKAMLLRQLQYPDDATANMFRKEIHTLEDGLKKIEANEAKYAAELKNALQQYAELQEQAAEFDSQSCTKQGRRFVPSMNAELHSECKKPTVINMICSVCMTASVV